MFTFDLTEAPKQKPIWTRNSDEITKEEYGPEIVGKYIINNSRIGDIIHKENIKLFGPFVSKYL